jgi:hypothetical protein
MLKKIILSSMLLLSSQVYADNLSKIFDLELGSKIDENKENIINNEKDKYKAYYRIDFKGFTKVMANYTPTTNKIYNIATLKPAETNCNAEAELIAGILSKRYGNFEVSKSSRNIYYEIISGNKSLLIGCNGFVDKDIIIMLTDKDLEKINKQEIIEIEAVKESNNF